MSLIIFCSSPRDSAWTVCAIIYQCREEEAQKSKKKEEGVADIVGASKDCRTHEGAAAAVASAKAAQSRPRSPVPANHPLIARYTAHM